MNWISYIRNNPDEALVSIYEDHRDDLIRYLSRKYDVNTDEAKDIFQSSIIILYDNVISCKLTHLAVPIKAYIRGIAKNRALKYHRDHISKYQLVDQSVLIDKESDQPIYEKEDDMTQQLTHMMASLGEKCRELLTLFYYRKRKMKEIALIMGYANIDTVKSKKYQCLQQLKSRF
jgi:RNA polymerase sigma factor, sigma-70 family